MFFFLISLFCFYIATDLNKRGKWRYMISVEAKPLFSLQQQWLPEVSFPLFSLVLKKYNTNLQKISFLGSGLFIIEKPFEIERGRKHKFTKLF